MKHYFNPMSRGATTDWMLRELDAPHERIELDFAAGDLQKPEFRAINPMGKIPTLVDGNVVITETAAICAYLADKFPDKQLAPPIGSPERGKYYRYMFFLGTTLEPLCSFNSLGIEGDPVSMGWGDMTRGLAAIESMTPETDWALGEQFTAADIIFGGALSFFSGFKMFEATPKVEAYIARLVERPAYKASHTAF